MICQLDGRPSGVGRLVGNKLLQKSCVKRFPPSSDACSLANAFADFFAQKINKIHSYLHENRTVDPDLSSSESTTCQVELSDFAVLSQDTVKEYACKSAKKSCNLDPLPASLMKNFSTCCCLL